MPSLWYTVSRVDKPSRQKRTPDRSNQMSPTTSNTKKVTRTVFDLATFDDVTLQKVVTLPNKPSTLEEALAAVDNDQAKLLDVIHEGLCATVEDAARADLSGFMTIPEAEGEASEVYAGSVATEEQGKLINAAVLTFAKMNGFSKDLSKEKKRELKDAAKTTLRPILIASLAPTS